MGELLVFIGASHTFASGNKVVHGQQGEVMGPAICETLKGKGLAMQFPGN